MAEKNAEETLDEIVGRFIEVYKILSPEEKIRFEIEIEKKTKAMDGKTKDLYLALIASAKKGLDIKETLVKMRKVK